jgi:TonB-dependent receptor
MKISLRLVVSPPCFRLRVFLSVLFVSLALGSVPWAQPAATGRLTGTVSNLATGRLLGGARVEIAVLGRSERTDDDGRFSLNDLPPGEHHVAIFYVGLDRVDETVLVQPGGYHMLRIELTEGIYRLGTFTVTGEREGTAAAITAQRNADNVKNIASIDAYGLMPNMGGGEFAMRLPGAAGAVDDDGTVSGIVVRGVANTLNRLTVDGGAVPANQSMSRGYQMQFVTTAMFDQVELIKGHTPDKGADSLGGTINFKTRSALSQAEKRVFTYNLGAIWAPPFTDQTPLRRTRALAPLTSGTYQEVFDVFGGSRNFGLALNALYSEKVIGYSYTIRDFQNTGASPAYLWDYRTRDDFARRFQTSLNLRMDFRLSRNSKFYLNAYSTDHFEPNRVFHDTQASTSQTLATIGASGQLSTTGTILPGYTDLVTRVRGLAASTIAVRDTATGFFLRTRGADLGGEHDFGRWHVDYNAAYHQTHVNLTSGPGAAAFTNTITGVGWTLDRSKSDLWPQFVQTEGPDMTNPANYRITGADSRHLTRNSGVEGARGNVRYTLPASFPLFLKSGVDVRTQTSGNVGGSRRWTYARGTLPANPAFMSTDLVKTGRHLPTWEGAWYFKNDEPRDPALWTENVYFREQSRYTTTSDVSETVTAGYVMGQAKFNQLGVLTGVRTERTDVDSFGRVRVHAGSTAAQQSADPIGSAQRDYANTGRRIEGDYTKSFPSAHLSYDVTPRIKGHLSWSTSFGRPQFNNLLPNETFNDTQRTLTTNNPALKPQTAANWDATFEYYLEPVGLFSVGWFHKKIADYIVTGIDAGTVGAGANNGYNGEYEGYDILSSSNAGNAFVQGVEFSYQQQLTFLPRPFNGLGLNANFTYLRTHGDYGTASARGKNELAGFIPETGNVNLTYKYRAFNTRVLINYTGRYITTFTATNSPRNEYKYARTIVNLGFGWQLRPSANLFCEIVNLFNETQGRFRGTGPRMSYTSINGTQLNFGVTGRF